MNVDTEQKGLWLGLRWTKVTTTYLLKIEGHTANLQEGGVGPTVAAQVNATHAQKLSESLIVPVICYLHLSYVFLNLPCPFLNLWNYRVFTSLSPFPLFYDF